MHVGMTRAAVVSLFSELYWFSERWSDVKFMKFSSGDWRWVASDQDRIAVVQDGVLVELAAGPRW